jgi:hypothetical protein
MEAQASISHRYNPYFIEFLLLDRASLDLLLGPSERESHFPLGFHTYSQGVKMLNMAEDLWAWVTEYPDGSVGLISVMLPGMGNTPLIGRSEKAIRTLEDIARAHGRTLNQKVWLRRYTKAEDIR